MNLGILLALPSALAYGTADVIGGGVLGERIGTGQRTGVGICTLAVATLALG